LVDVLDLLLIERRLLASVADAAVERVLLVGDGVVRCDVGVPHRLGHDEGEEHELESGEAEDEPEEDVPRLRVDDEAREDGCDGWRDDDGDTVHAHLAAADCRRKVASVTQL
jgi:hypothetical protein